MKEAARLGRSPRAVTLAARLVRHGGELPMGPGGSAVRRVRRRDDRALRFFCPTA
jgi:hypothetical protein